MHTNTENLARTFYFGLPVEVVFGLKAYSLVRFSGREIIVDANDLKAEPGIQITGALFGRQFLSRAGQPPQVRIATTG